MSKPTCTGTRPTITELVWAAEASETTALYFVQAGGCGPIKIGITKPEQVTRRVQDLQVGCPWRLTLRKAMYGSRELEQRLHQTFSTYRMSGEWFYPFPELVEWVNGEHPPHDSPDWLATS